jgi:hypothetical protein
MCRVSARRLLLHHRVLRWPKTNLNQNYHKKSIFSISTYEGYLTEFAMSSQNHKKSLETPEENFLKKSMFQFL